MSLVDDYDVLCRSIRRSQQWVKFCVQEISSQVQKRPRSKFTKGDERELFQIFASYYLELFLREQKVPFLREEHSKKKPALQRIRKQEDTLVPSIDNLLDSLVDQLRQASGLNTLREILTGSSVQKLSIYPSIPYEVEGPFLVLGESRVYFPYKVTEEKVTEALKFELARKAWIMDWDVFSPQSFEVITPASLVNYFSSSLFQDTKGDILATILPPSEYYFSFLTEKLAQSRYKNREILLISSRELLPRELEKLSLSRKELPTSQKFMSYFEGTFYITILGDEKKILTKFREGLPKFPREDITFPTMFENLQDLAKNLPVQWSSSKGTEVGRVIRRFPEDYNSADSISDYFSLEERMSCHAADRITGVSFSSRMEEWSKIKLFRNEVAEKEGFLPTPENLSEYLHNKQRKACALFNAGLAVFLYTKYGGPNSRVLDLFAGWTDRLIAAYASGCAEYTGFDPNTNIDYNKAISVLGEYSDTEASVAYELAENAIVNENYFDVTVMSPPFYTYELYSGEETSTTKYPTLELWIQDFWKVCLEKALRSIRKGGWIILYIPSDPGDWKQVPQKTKFPKKTFIPVRDEIAIQMNKAKRDVLHSGVCKDYGIISYALVEAGTKPMYRTLYLFRKL